AGAPPAAREGALRRARRSRQGGGEMDPNSGQRPNGGPRRPTSEDSANFALVSAWRTTAAIPQALRDAFWTPSGRAICVICRAEKSPFAGPIVIVYTAELDPNPASIPALACDDCLGGGVDRSEISGRARRIASE